jgi:Protein of unknown function (DUF4240)
MDETAFWAIIRRCHEAAAGEMGRKCDLIKTEMIALSKKDAQAFARYFEQATDRAYCWPLWGAAYVINGGCGDDTFSDFRASLISRGRVAFEQALSDPESLADEDIDESSWFYEGFQYAVHDGIKANLGFRPARSTPYPDSPSGTAWSEETVNIQSSLPRSGDRGDERPSVLAGDRHVERAGVNCESRKPIDIDRRTRCVPSHA